MDHGQAGAVLALSAPVISTGDPWGMVLLAARCLAQGGLHELAKEPSVLHLNSSTHLKAGMFFQDVFCLYGDVKPNWCAVAASRLQICHCQPA